MSQPEPKFSVGERVMVCVPDYPKLCSHDAVIVGRKVRLKGARVRRGLTNCYETVRENAWVYQLSGNPESYWFREYRLRPRPKPPAELRKEISSPVVVS